MVGIILFNLYIWMILILGNLCVLGMAAALITYLIIKVVEGAGWLKGHIKERNHRKCYHHPFNHHLF